MRICVKNYPFRRQKKSLPRHKKALFIKTLFLFVIGTFACAHFGVFSGSIYGANPTPLSLIVATEPDESIRLRHAEAVAAEMYDEARAISDSLLSNPKNPASKPWGNLFTATLVLAEMIDYGDTLGYGRYIDCLESAVAGFNYYGQSGAPEELSDISDSAAWCFAAGVLEALEAQRLAEVEKSPLQAAGPAARSSKLFSLAVEYDNSRTQAIAGSAAYHFWKSHVLRFVSWTPLVKDRRGEAMLSLESLTENSKPNLAASISLMWMLIESDQCEEAAAIGDSLLVVYGEVRSILEPCGKAYYKLKRWREARDRYRRLVASIQAAPRRNLVREAGALHRLAHIAEAQEDWNAVAHFANNALQLPLNESQAKRKKDDLRRLRKLLARANDHLEDN